MDRRPRIAPALIALAALVALFAATSATGRSTAKPANTLEPTIVPTKQAIIVGTTLTGNKGNWSGTEPITYHYQWVRCNEDGQKCAKIQNARGTTYTIVQKDAGHTLRFGVEAQNSDGKAQAVSNASAEIPGSAKAPAQTAIPTISGSAVVGEKLTATTGSWAGTQPITYTINWQVCNQQSASCAPNGSKGAVYTVANSDVGKRLRVRVAAKNSAGESSGLSDTTAVVTQSGGGGGGGGSGNAVPVGDVGPAGERLVVDRVVFNPNPVTSRNVPIQVKITVKDTKGRLVKGALVFIRSTPILTSTPTDAPTGNDGTVTYSIQPRSDFPIKNGYSVQFFVKAYRQGDPSLAGIAGTRLVQVATHTP
jgi:hypothetical protein